MTTWCRECDFVHSATREKEPWKWRCMKVKTAPGFGFVDPQFSPDPPYERCSQVNRHGDCEFYSERRQPTGK